MNAATKWAVVDDNDPSIQYSPGWNREEGNPQEYSKNSGEPYLGTLHAIEQDGSLSFQYHGSNIIVWGLDLGNSSTRASWKCFVDGYEIRIPQSSPVPQNNWPLCDDNGMLNGPNAIGLHTLTISVTTTPSNAAFRIDWIQYNPQPGFVFDSPDGQRSTTMLVDNTDPSIHFDECWAPWTYLYQTANITSQGGQVTIDFIGTSISWFGIAEPGNFSQPAQGSYSIDGGDDVSFHWTTDLGMQLDRRFLFEIDNLSFGSHQAVVKYLGPALAPSLMLDYLVIQNASTTKVATSSGLGPYPSTTPTSNQNTGSGIAAGAIAASVVGGLALLVVLLLVWFKRKLSASRRRSRYTQATPFIMPAPAYYHVPRQMSGGTVGSAKSSMHSHSHSRTLSDPFSLTSEHTPMLGAAQPMARGSSETLNTSSLHPPPQSRPPSAMHQNHSHPLGQGISTSPAETLPLYEEVDRGNSR